MISSLSSKSLFLHRRAPFLWTFFFGSSKARSEASKFDFVGRIGIEYRETFYIVCIPMYVTNIIYEFES